jgi:transketolase
MGDIISMPAQEIENKDSNQVWKTFFAGTTRDMYRKTLLELAQQDARIYCLDSDQGGLEESFARFLPAQYVEMGIAEANMITVAAALASSGKIPFVNTMAGFASARACEQVKIDVAYNNLPVKIVATHAGFSSGHLGPTHHSLEDVAIMRAFPNMTVIVPADTVETRKAIQAALLHNGPVYVRLGRRATDIVYTTDYEYKIGHAVQLRAGNDITLIASGPYPLQSALEAHDFLVQRGIAARVLNFHTIKPLDGATLIAAARETQCLITIEEHSILGGLGGAVAERVAEEYPVPIRRIGVPDVFCPYVGNQQELLNAYRITSERIVEEALALLHNQ